ncbi:MAG: MoaD/ThiS family protein [Dehalococcoidia bacterium]
MKVDVRLFASLRYRLAGESRGSVQVELAEGGTLADVLRALNVPQALAGMVLVNGQRCPSQGQATRALREGDRVSIFPPMAGGQRQGLGHSSPRS